MEYAIIGGGIGGLTAAIALSQRGIEAHVFEAAPALGVVGAGIAMPTNAMQVLARLGLAGAVQGAGRLVRRAELHDAVSGRLQLVDLTVPGRRYGFGMVAIHRARLQQILAAALGPGTLHLDRAFTGLSEHPERQRVSLRFRDGSTDFARVVIGADGMRSAVRRELFGAVRLRYSGHTSYRGVAALRLPAELDHAAREVWGAGCRFGFLPIGDEEVYWFATLDAPAGGIDEPRTALARLQARFAAFPEPVPELLQASTLEAVTRTDMYDLPPLRRWHAGRVVLVGDAAHAATPNLGQGGAQAIEDAYVLADALATQHHALDAFREYERLRQRKAALVVRRSWQLGRIVHLANPLARGLRNLLLRATPDAVTRRQLDALYALAY